LAKLEETLKDESLSEQQKQEKRQQHAQKESEFLRLKRSRLGVEDFEPLKVIGRGAFGEVIESNILDRCSKIITYSSRCPVKMYETKVVVLIL